jgi:hypothetical protein
MFANRLLTCLGIVAVTTPALCAQFYIVQDPTTKQCTISEQPPAPGAGTVVGDGAYGDRASAEADMRTISACMEAARTTIALAARGRSTRLLRHSVGMRLEGCPLETLFPLNWFV